MVTARSEVLNTTSSVEDFMPNMDDGVVPRYYETAEPEAPKVLVEEPDLEVFGDE